MLSSEKVSQLKEGMLQPLCSKFKLTQEEKIGRKSSPFCCLKFLGTSVMKFEESYLTFLLRATKKRMNFCQI
ncbi:Uncharacterised protein [Mycobacteroides abscessus subsp. abscessus]|nr:Uncharacterised protein [Mycobacteroides abscessus subsp. abscessus]